MIFGKKKKIYLLYVYIKFEKSPFTLHLPHRAKPKKPT